MVKTGVVSLDLLGLEKEKSPILLGDLSPSKGRGVSRVLFPRSSLWDPCRHEPQAVHPQVRRAGLALPAYWTLHQVGFTSRSGLPVRWWALTPPFHPCQFVAPPPRGSAGEIRSKPLAVYSLLHFPSGCPAQPLAGTLPYGARTFLTRFRERDRAPFPGLNSLGQ